MINNINILLYYRWTKQTTNGYIYLDILTLLCKEMYGFEMILEDLFGA